ncbi:MAG: EamA family transporter [Coriobacteriaceae bacterium]|nr:EamA family transporter [Coriobacteriaceae bacterium]
MGLASSIKPGADAGADARAARRSMRERLNDGASRKLMLGVLATLFGGIFWGFSGTSASYLFDVYHVDTVWLLSIRQLIAGAMFMAVILLFDRARFVQLLKTPHDLAVMAFFTFSGVFANSLTYLLAVRYTNAGTATVMQCLQLVIIMVYTCMRMRRAPRRRELAGVVLAFAGAYLIATGGDPSALVIPPEGLVMGLVSAVAAACMSIVPTKILPVYGSSIVTGSAMFASGLVLSVFVRPWSSMPSMAADGWIALAILIVVGSFLAYNLYMQGVKDIGSVRASLIGTVEPVSATITSALVLGTVFAPTDIIGFACIIVMVFLTV